MKYLITYLVILVFLRIIFKIVQLLVFVQGDNLKDKLKKIHKGGEKPYVKDFYKMLFEYLFIFEPKKMDIHPNFQKQRKVLEILFRVLNVLVYFLPIFFLIIFLSRGGTIE